jgi:hypothetical protein
MRGELLPKDTGDAGVLSSILGDLIRFVRG